MYSSDNLTATSDVSASDCRHTTIVIDFQKNLSLTSPPIYEYVLIPLHPSYIVILMITISKTFMMTFISI